MLQISWLSLTKMSLSLISFHANPAIIFLRSLANDGSTNPANDPTRTALDTIPRPAGLESCDGEQAAAHLAALLGPPPRIPPAPWNENHFLPGFSQRQGPRRRGVISGMCANKEFRGVLFAPLSLAARGRG